MNIRHIVTIIALGITVPVSAWNNNWVYVPFDTAMLAHSRWYEPALLKTHSVVGVDGLVMYQFFKTIYDVNNPSALADAGLRLEDLHEIKIPKIIHQIWIGGPLPQEFKDFVQSWRDAHPGWEYRLWTDEDVKTFGLYNQAFYDQSDNYGVKSDILKWEIIYRYGGLYVDTDYECLQSFDMYHYLYDFYSGIQPLDTQFVQLGAALFAARPGHPILKHCIETIKDDWHHKGAPTKTGPVHYTKSLYYVVNNALAQSDVELGLIFLFPSHHVYPLGSRQAALEYGQWMAQGALAVHHWSMSWMPSEYRRARFKYLSINQATTKSWND